MGPLRDKDGCALHGNVWCTCPSVSQFLRDLEQARKNGEVLAKQVLCAIAADKKKRLKKMRRARRARRAFYLSPMAALGILRRASKRGTELPLELHSALKRLAARALKKLAARKRRALKKLDARKQKANSRKRRKANGARKH